MFTLLNIGLAAAIFTQTLFSGGYFGILDPEEPVQPFLDITQNAFLSQPLFAEDCFISQNNPETKLKTSRQRIKVVVTAYTSRPEETDETPDITASGTKTRNGIVATNLLPMGTLIKIPSLFGQQCFVVEDRMHPRYQKRVDVWFDSLDEARQFGKRMAEIEII